MEERPLIGWSDFQKEFEAFNAAMMALGDRANAAARHINAIDTATIAGAEQYYNEHMADVHARRKARQQKSAARRKKRKR